MAKTKLQRIGRFKIAKGLLDLAKEREHSYLQLSLLFSVGIIILGVLPDSTPGAECYHYIGLWSGFDEMESTGVIPYYDMTIDQVKGIVIAKRVKE